jgi:hypothetical protein
MAATINDFEASEILLIHNRYFIITSNERNAAYICRDRGLWSKEGLNPGVRGVASATPIISQKYPLLFIPLSSSSPNQFAQLDASDLAIPFSFDIPNG